jgi:hypothetical protein
MRDTEGGHVHESYNKRAKHEAELSAQVEEIRLSLQSALALRKVIQTGSGAITWEKALEEIFSCANWKPCSVSSLSQFARGEKAWVIRDKSRQGDWLMAIKAWSEAQLIAKVGYNFCLELFCHRHRLTSYVHILSCSKIDVCCAGSRGRPLRTANVAKTGLYNNAEMLEHAALNMCQQDSRLVIQI